MAVVVPTFVLCPHCGQEMYACEDGYECADENMEYRQDCAYFIKHGRDRGYYMTYKAGRAQWIKRVKKDAAALDQWRAWGSA